MQRLFRFLRPYRLSILVTLVLLFLQSISQLYLPTLMANIVDIGIVRGDTAYIWRVGGRNVWCRCPGRFVHSCS